MTHYQTVVSCCSLCEKLMKCGMNLFCLLKIIVIFVSSILANTCITCRMFSITCLSPAKKKLKKSKSYCHISTTTSAKIPIKIGIMCAIIVGKDNLCRSQHGRFYHSLQLLHSQLISASQSPSPLQICRRLKPPQKNSHYRHKTA